MQYDGRNRLSNFWTPTQLPLVSSAEHENGHDLLARAGFLRQAHSGIFHLLPLGLRVQDKIERLIDKHMLRLGASKVSLSCLSSEELWQKSGRLDKGRSSELLRLEDRKGAKYLLSPTHEEEITTIVANSVQSYKELPLRLYQVSRKYRDEPRPRQGLLRSREFLMKDLYTFDASEEAARQTYEAVRKAYAAVFDELRLPYLTCAADSGNMGGNLSHEFHFSSSQGEDTIISCDECDYSINEELYVGRHNLSADPPLGPKQRGAYELTRTACISKDRNTLYLFDCLANHGDFNIHAAKAILPDYDSALQSEEAVKEFSNQPGFLKVASHFLGDANGSEKSIVLFHDPRLSKEFLAQHWNESVEAQHENYQIPAINGEAVLLTKAQDGDRCPNCGDGQLKLQQAVEIGHTFHLGQRYSVPLEAKVLDASNKQINVEMGCHGIGVSRLIGAVAALLADTKGLNWPLAISPFNVVIVAGNKVEPAHIAALYDQLSGSDDTHPGSDVAIDDRHKPMGWRMNDADLIGYPFIIVMGNAWKEKCVVELQCRRLGFKAEMDASNLVDEVRALSKQL